MPIEISRIRDGGISPYIGAFINEDFAEWYADDADRQIFIAVQGNAGASAKSVPAQGELNPNQMIRQVNANGVQRSEFVTVVSATPQQAQEKNSGV